MGLPEKLIDERRARLAAQRLLEQKQRELYAANEKLAIHARSLSEQIVEQRLEVENVRLEAAVLKGQIARYLTELDLAHTAAVMAERRLWDSIETIGDGFAVFDHTLTLVAANQSYLAVFEGLEEVKPGIGYGEVLQLVAEEGIVDIGDRTTRQWCAEMLDRWNADPIPPMVIQLYNGAHIKLMDRRARDGDMVSLALNITDTIRREAQLKEARQRAEAATRAKSAFLANMSHEIRTPMNGVVGMAELLCESQLSAEQRLYAQTIRTSGEALLVIINDVLDYSKIEADKLTLKPEPFDLERCIHEVAMLLHPAAQAKQLAVVVDYDMFLPTRFIGDPGRTRQVLANLIGNAVKFTASGHVMIRVVGFEAQSGAQQLHITVEDTGIGIAPENLDHIFGEFNQVEDQSNRKFEGTGLGLAITRQLVGLMGGTVWVDSEEGVGSSFGFRLILPVAEPAPDVTLPPSSLRRVMVVDESPVNRKVLERQLVALGLKVTLCTSGAQALAVMESDPFHDLVITEHDMAGTDGVALAATLRARALTMPILMLSANPGKSAAAAGAAQVNAIFQKPLLRSELCRRIKALAIADGFAKTPSAPRRQMRVLSAEDNRTNQLVFRKMVQGLDIDLAFANNGREAVEMAESFAPDMIFMDISMPEMDGREATRRIRAREAALGLPRLPIIALTAHAMEGDATSILAAGLDRYLTKPLRKGAIIEAIEAAHPAGTRPLVMADAIAAGASADADAGRRLESVTQA